jgi:hypothetical protein
MGLQVAISMGLIATLLAIAGLHVYWGMGGFWPGTDGATLVEHVVGRTRAMVPPSFLACMIVASGLVGICVLLMGRLGIVALPFGLGGLVPFGLWAAAVIFGLRGVAGFIPGIFDYAKGTPFYTLNTTYYSPLCLVICLAIVVINFPASTPN